MAGDLSVRLSVHHAADRVGGESAGSGAYPGKRTSHPAIRLRPRDPLGAGMEAALQNQTDKANRRP